MGALKYWLWLTELGKMPGVRVFSLLEHFGSPESAYFADDEEYDQLMGFPQSLKNSLRVKSLERADKILSDCEGLGVRILTIQDAEYPERLRQISDPPCVLFVKGKLPVIDDEAAIAIVGARAATPYGEVTAGRLGLELARQGALVVSGIARGVDSAAIRGALKGGGKVISVLGNGADVIYPRENRKLYEDVAQAGALISEYPPGTEPNGSYFPVRNRIISGLSLGVVVVEGDDRSGSLITARLALDQNRDVFAVPGNWDAPMSRGPNSLIRKGEAKLILNDWDILGEYRDLYPHRIRPKMPLPEPIRQERIGAQEENRKIPSPPGIKKPSVSEQEKDRMEISLSEKSEEFTDDEKALLLVLEGKILTADDLIEKTEIPARRILSALTMLQVRGMVAEEPGKRFRTPVVLKP